jgi:hypothetical protein
LLPFDFAQGRLSAVQPARSVTARSSDFGPAPTSRFVFRVLQLRGWKDITLIDPVVGVDAMLQPLPARSIVKGTATSRRNIFRPPAHSSRIVAVVVNFEHLDGASSGEYDCPRWAIH